MPKTPHLSGTTPSSSREPYNVTLGDDAMLGDDNAKLGDNVATPLLTTAAMTTTMKATVAAAVAVARMTKTAAVTYRQQLK